MTNALSILGIIGFLLGGVIWFWTLSLAFEIITFCGLGCLLISLLIPEKRVVFHPAGFYPPV